MSCLFFVLLFMSICFSLPQSNFLNGVGSEYEALLISLSLINKIEDFPLFPVTGSGVLGKSQEVQIILSQSPEVAVNDAAALQTRISQHHDFSCRVELVIRRHQATSALEKHYPTACQGSFTCYYCLQEPKQCLSRLLLFLITIWIQGVC